MKRAFVNVLVFIALGASAFAQPAPTPSPPPNTGSMGFKGASEAAPKGTPRTADEALALCAADVQRLERDEVGVPYLAGAYIAFFCILLAFFVMAQVRQKRMEAEMAELRDRLARLMEERG